MPLMHSLTLQNDNRADVAEALSGDRWVVACLCAAWCGTCGGYRATFEQIAARNPDHVFLWIDIEDQSDVVGDLDVDNFPTLLIQRGETVAFFGTVLPDPALAERLVASQLVHGDEELARMAASTEERRGWQQQANLRALLRAAGQ
ncbi:MAG: thiol reductase thioredoxin [Massilia sp.]|jgi:thioredoxin 1|nr:thiol reductase thioredoxin [Massilia sp.]MDB5952991.1 thiol reductase thioredoxin [Massilia sp.]